MSDFVIGMEPQGGNMPKAKSLSITAYRAYGDVIIEPFDAESVPAVVKAPLKAFAGAAKAYGAAADAVDSTRAARDAALEAIGDADDALDKSVLFLADELV